METDQAKIIETDLVGETVVVQRVRIPAPLARQLRELLEEPTLGFASLEHVILAGLWSFCGFKRRQLAALRRDAEGLK